MKQKYILLPLIGAIVGSSTLGAQGLEVIPSVQASALLPSDKLSTSDLFGYGVGIYFKPSPIFRLGLVGTKYSKGEYFPVAGAARELSASSIGVDLDATLIGSRNRVFLSLAPSIHSFSVDAGATEPKKSVRVPSAGVGLGFSFAPTEHVSLDLITRDAITWTRNDPLSLAPTGTRKIGHSPEFRVRFNVHLKKRDKVADFEGTPEGFQENYRPVTASEVQTSELKATQGLEHVHLKNEVERSLEPEVRDNVLRETSRLGTVYFRTNSFEVPAENQKVIQRIAEYMRTNPRAIIRVNSYASPTGSIRGNMSLAERRAAAVRNQLVYYYQIEPDRIEATTGGIDPEPKAGKFAQRAEIYVLEVLSQKP